MENESICIVGAGNVAHVLGHALNKAGVQISQILGRNEEAEKLAFSLKAQFISDFSQLNSSIILLAIPDDKLVEISSQFHTNSLVSHCSGTKEMNVLACCSSHFGVFYPFVSMQKSNLISFQNVPIFVEGNSESVAQTLNKIGQKISTQVSFLDTIQRQHLHLAAVFANNFTNHFFNLAEKICAENQVDFNLLKPLMENHFKQLLQTKPALLQTGPAIRKDNSTMEMHAELLKNHTTWKELYLLISKDIQQINEKN